jgi:hypothetical protein
MAKVPFTKLGLSKNQEVKTIEFNEQNIEVKQYLPINDKLDLIANVINLAHDDKNYSNPVKAGVYFALGVVEKYTNITFTEKQKEDPTKLYDLLSGNNLYKMIYDAIPASEVAYLADSLYKSIEAIYSYQNSVLGILESVSQDYSQLKLDANEIKEDLADPNNLTLLKDILSKLG